MKRIEVKKEDEQKHTEGWLAKIGILISQLNFFYFFAAPSALINFAGDALF